MKDTVMTKLDAVAAENQALRARLAEIATYASHESAGRGAWSMAGAAFEKIARMAQEEVTA